jgi:multiple sugar transport system permease protein
MATSGTRLLSSNRAGWAMAAPAFGLILLFIIVPFALAFGLSFTNQRLFSPNPTQWVGTANFKQLLGVGVLTLGPERDEAGALKLDKDGQPAYPRLRGYTRNNPDYPRLQGMQEWFSFQRGESRTYVLASDVVFMKAMKNTFLFVLVVAPLQGGLALLLALMINQKLRGINFFRAVYFMPVVVSIVVVSLLWRFIYADDSGLLNNVLSWVTLGAFKPVDWLGNPSTALPAIMAMSIWQAVGFHMVIWLAGLQTIPPTLYEAANIEGASRWQEFWHVTMPSLRNTHILVVMTTTIFAFKLFTQVQLLTQGGPAGATDTLVRVMYMQGFRQGKVGIGAAAAVIFFLLVLVISLLQRRLVKEERAIQ